MIDFTQIDYLRHRTVKQKLAHGILTKYRVLERLQPFDPILTGTIPINIDTDTSDLDIICCFRDADTFKKNLIEKFEHELNFKMFTPRRAGAIAAAFVLDGFVVEIYGQPVPVHVQSAYRHMIIEYKILQEKGEVFRQQIIELKKQGIKTEPAFGKLLGIEGDVYDELIARYST